MSSSSSEESLTHAFKDSLEQTKKMINDAIDNGNKLINLQEEKINESQLMINAARDLNSASFAFTSAIDHYNEERDHNVIEQLIETNENVESTFIAFNEYVANNTSSRASLVKTALSLSAPLLPIGLYYCFKVFQKIAKPAIKIIVENVIIDNSDDNFVLPFLSND